jgi:dimethylargininase
VNRRLVALTRPVSASFARCELELATRQPIDLDRAVEQHSVYERCLAELGAEVVRLPAEPGLPDSVFVEDLAVVVDQVAVMANPRSPVRRRERASVAAELGRHRPLRRLRAPATLEGGDVLRAGDRVFVGLSRRTNAAGRVQLERELAPLGYSIHPVEVRGCMHLKTGCCYLGSDALLMNPRWIDPGAFRGFEILETPPEEPFAANVLVVNNTVLVASSFPATQRVLSKSGRRISTVDISELMKAEAGLTCMSILWEEGVTG